MSYKISYGSMPRNAASKQKPQLRWAAIAVFIVTMAIFARSRYPAQIDQLTEALFPLTSASSREALDVFSQHIRDGETFGEAVTAFCMEIIHEGDAK
jgi:hypothetical protein